MNHCEPAFTKETPDADRRYLNKSLGEKETLAVEGPIKGYAKTTIGEGVKNWMGCRGDKTKQPDDHSLGFDGLGVEAENSGKTCGEKQGMGEAAMSKRRGVFDAKFKRQNIGVWNNGTEHTQHNQAPRNLFPGGEQSYAQWNDGMGQYGRQGFAFCRYRMLLCVEAIFFQGEGFDLILLLGVSLT